MHKSEKLSDKDCILYEKLISDLLEFELEAKELSDFQFNQDMANSAIDIIHTLLRLGYFTDVFEILKGLKSQLMKVKTRKFHKIKEQNGGHGD